MLPAMLAALLLVRPAAAAGKSGHELASFSPAPDLSGPLEDRVAPIPAWLLELWAEEDKAPYANHVLTPKEKREFSDAVRGLPGPMRAAMRERLLAFYFVENLKGNGITDWVLDGSSRTFAYMILNPAAFDESLSQVLTERERSVFRGAADLSVDAGPGGSGILYTVAHESAHAFDYVRRLTPFVEPGLAARLGQKAPASWDVWGSYAKPLPRADFPARAKLHFYGFGAPELEAADAPAVCAELARSPFTSLYGSRNWADDAAELFVAAHLTRDLGRPYRLACGGKTYELAARRAVARRIEKILAPMREEPK